MCMDITLHLISSYNTLSRYYHQDIQKKNYSAVEIYKRHLGLQIVKMDLAIFLHEYQPCLTDRTETCLLFPTADQNKYMRCVDTHLKS